VAARFLIDEDVSIHLAGLLAQRGHDAVTARQLGLAGKGSPDSEILVVAIELDRIVITENHRDFLALHQLSHRLAEVWQVSGRLTAPHPGILTVHSVPTQSIHLTEAAISQFVNAQASLAGELHYWRKDGQWQPFPIPRRNPPSALLGC
jgi:predicted nuclease of predicted toxin-antitoxin system